MHTNKFSLQPPFSLLVNFSAKMRNEPVQNSCLMPDTKINII